MAQNYVQKINFKPVEKVKKLYQNKPDKTRHYRKTILKIYHTTGKKQT